MCKKKNRTPDTPPLTFYATETYAGKLGEWEKDIAQVKGLLKWISSQNFVEWFPYTTTFSVNGTLVYYGKITENLNSISQTLHIKNPLRKHKDNKRKKSNSEETLATAVASMKNVLEEVQHWGRALRVSHPTFSLLSALCFWLKLWYLSFLLLLHAAMLPIQL